MLPQEFIRLKRDGKPLPREAIAEFVKGMVSGAVSEGQVAAFGMAVFLNGMGRDEAVALTLAMRDSGEVLKWNLPGPVVDKHSTGGVGDNVSLMLAPIVAACGAYVPMISGRGLGHTGGTLDKMDSIPGYVSQPDNALFRKVVRDVGCAIIGQTGDLAPADKRFYSIRDVTATVESIPLIASSIMSKKLAEGIDALVLDCKVGHGAFMKSSEDARKLALAIQVIGRAAGKPVTAVLSDMNEPIGSMVGNALEVAESIDVLHGKGPADTRELTVVLGGEMLHAAGVVESPESGQASIAEVLDNGAAAQLFAKLIEAQGGDPRVVEQPQAILPKAKVIEDICASHSGVVTAIAAQDVGVAGLWLGAGRRRADADVDPAVGIELCRKVGDTVEAGAPIARLHHNETGVSEARELILGAYRIGESADAPGTRILEVLR